MFRHVLCFPAGSGADGKLGGGYLLESVFKLGPAMVHGFWGVQGALGDVGEGGIQSA